jgi:hypothetical protein
MVISARAVHEETEPIIYIPARSEPAQGYEYIITTRSTVR